MSSLKPTQERITITTAGSPKVFSNVTLKVQDVLVIADPANTGVVYIGDSAVSASSGLGIPLNSSESATIDSTKYFGTEEFLDLNLFYVDSTSSGDVIILIYLEREVD